MILIYKPKKADKRFLSDSFYIKTHLIMVWLTIASCLLAPYVTPKAVVLGLLLMLGLQYHYYKSLKDKLDEINNKQCTSKNRERVNYFKYFII